MANIAEPLEFTVLLQLEINKGNSVRAALQNTLKSLGTQFSKDVGIWLIQYQKGIDYRLKSKSAARIQLLQLLKLGFDGVPILEPLEALKNQMLDICNEDIRAQIDGLPTLMAFPMIIFFLPAFMFLIGGPVLWSLL